MKKIILYIAVLTMTLSSCGDEWLNLDKDNAFTSEQQLTYKDLQALRVGLYDGIQAGPDNDVEYYAAKFFYNGDVRGDDFQYNKNGSGRAQASYAFSYSTSDAGGAWKTAYYTIALANSIINIKLTPSDLSLYEKEINEIKGEAYFLRALCHFDLLRDYSDFWNINSTYGVPIVSEPATGDITQRQPGRSTVKEVYDWIVKELTKNAIPNMSTKRHDNGFADVWAAKALLSRVYLFMGENEKCVNIAEEVIANDAGYKLWSNSEYKDAWSKMNTSEAVFEIINTKLDNFFREGIGYLMESSTNSMGYADIIATIQYTKLFDDNDVRRSLFFSAKEGDPKVYLDKYPGVVMNADGTDWDNMTQNFPVIRLSELYLNAAEAGIKAGGEYAVKGNKFLTEIVQRANPNAPAITNANLERVLFERRLELGGEGWRVSDALRNNKKMYRDNLDGYLADINLCQPAVNVAIKASDIEANEALHSSLDMSYYMIDRNCSKIVLPIPKKEMDVNGSIKTQQFPSWL